MLGLGLALLLTLRGWSRIIDGNRGRALFGTMLMMLRTCSAKPGTLDTLMGMGAGAATAVLDLQLIPGW